MADRMTREEMAKMLAQHYEMWAMFAYMVRPRFTEEELLQKPLEELRVLMRELVLPLEEEEERGEVELNKRRRTMRE